MEAKDLDCSVGQDGRSLDERRYDLDRFKAEQEAKLQLRRLALDRENARQERRILRNPVLLPAAIALGSVLVSGTQVWVSYISKEKEIRAAEIQKDKELALIDLQSKRQYCIDGAKVAEDYLNKSGSSLAQKQFGSSLIQTTCPQVQVGATNIDSAPPHLVLSPPVGEELSIKRESDDNQVIPLSSWKNFAALVVDRNGRPVEGAKVAWRTPDMGSYTYVGVTDVRGVSTATNLYTSSTTGTHQQTADVVDRQTPLGFTDWANLRPTGKSIAFQFRFSGN